MVCDICGKKRARVRRMTRTCGHGRSAFLIEDLPVVTCLSCGESYLTAATLKEIERIRMHWRQLTVKREVPVARFGAA
ncbi:MAG: YgiT-type zinc finger protein [Planctomycetes bacterium]|nr:YgiT-type zinc finger protein [Planctomycetota bacterium]